MPAPLSQHLMDEDISAAMQMITLSSDPSDWTEEERALAYKGGEIPADLEPEGEDIIFE
ncbi:MAG: hypothetical protein ACO3K3_00940 [Schleiferiaceae bacterium]